ncbi:unnamed protein product, partial [Iphiclides podalirius]
MVSAGIRRVPSGIAETRVPARILPPTPVLPQPPKLCYFPQLLFGFWIRMATLCSLELCYIPVTYIRSLSSDLRLADPKFDTTGPVDVLLGADVLGKLFLTGKRVLHAEGLVAMDTKLGNVLLGLRSNRSLRGNQTMSWSGIRFRKQSIPKKSRYGAASNGRSASGSGEGDEARFLELVGTDFAGPFMIKASRLWNLRLVKACLFVFLCLTKAVHLEVVADLTTEAFIFRVSAALPPYISIPYFPCQILTQKPSLLNGDTTRTEEYR